MKKSTVFALLLIVIVLIPTVSHAALTIASDGSGSNTIVNGIVTWWKSLWN